MTHTTSERKTADTPDALSPLFAPLHPIFRECVRSWVGKRYALHRPFLIGDHVYASNSAIIVRKSLPVGTKKSVYRLAINESIPETAPALFEGKADPDTGKVSKKVLYSWETTPIALPGFPLPEPCDYCKGTGGSHGLRCAECHGTRWRYDVDSDSIRVVLSDPGIVPVFAISQRYAHLLQRHAATLYRPLSAGKRLDPLRFTIEPGGVEGLVMPLNVEKR